MSSLLNLDNVPNNMLSGLDDEMVTWVTEESNERYLAEMTSAFIENLNQEETTYFEVPEEVDRELDRIEKEAMPTSTKKQTENYVNKFRRFLEENNLSPNFEEIPNRILNDYLRFFYSKLRKSDGGMYSPATLVCIRAAIHRHLTSAEVNKKINILKDDDFKRSNVMLKSMVGKFLKEGDGSCQSYPAIEQSDLIKMKQFFDRSSGAVLQMEVWFNLLYYFALRGRETIRYLTLESFSVSCDSDNIKYVSINHDFISKNTKASLIRKEYENIKQCRMYENNSVHCPVVAFELYMDKLKQSGCSDLFPLPTKGDKNPWYCKNRVLGKNTLAGMMKKISTEAKLSKVYTNHSIRVTSVTVLKEEGMTNSDIQSVTGHKNEASVSRYIRHRSDAAKRSFSVALSQTQDKEREVKMMKLDATCSSGKSTIRERFVLSGNFNNCTFNFPSDN